MTIQSDAPPSRKRASGFTRDRRLPAPPVRLRECTRGFTLVELLVALGLMAVVSLLGWRGLDTVIRSRERIVEHSEAIRALSVAFSQMEEDLRRSWPVRLRLPGAQTLGFRPQEGGGLALELVRESPVTGGGLQRVAWRLREGTLERGFAAWQAAGGDGEGRAAAMDLLWQPVVPNVSAVAIRGYVPGRGWLSPEALPMRQAGGADAATSPATGPGSEARAGAQAGATADAGAQPAAASGAGAQPGVGAVTGIELVIERLDGERVQRVFLVKD